MTDITVKLLSAEIQIPLDRLVQKFADIGIEKTAVDFVTQQEKDTLLAYLKRDRNRLHNKLTLQRKTRSTLHIPSNSGKSKSVQIEVRKKHTYLEVNPLMQVKSEELGYQYTKNEDATKTKRDNKEKVKRAHEDKIKRESTKKVNRMVLKSDKTTDQQHNAMIKSLQVSKKTYLEVESAKIKRTEEEEVLRKAEEKVLKVAEEVRRIDEECSNNWNNAPHLDEEDGTDYHITTSYYAREAEDENDRKLEGDRRNRIRSVKTIKQKKTNRLSASKDDREEARSANRGNKIKRKSSTLTQIFNKPELTVNRDVLIGETISVSELANKMATKSSQVIKAMMKMGAMATINQIIDQETAQLIAEEMGHKVIVRHENELEESVMSDRDIGNLAASELRAPIVTIMGHVDHGKTSLLDYIRSTKVAARELGGITQHIGAYHVKTHNGMITFLDTPGHTAFTAMRARGAQATDIVVLVVAADDGVMPQTIEAIQHAKAAKVPLVVVVNKIDKSEADPDRIKNELIQYGVVPEEWGGDSQFIHVSAKSGEGIDKLLDAILLQAEILDLKATRNGMASGVVIESFLDKGRGPVATILVREGTLHRGDIVLCGFKYGRVRAMRNEMGRNVISAGPSMPIEILGLSGVPVAGDKATVVRDEKKAREVALYRQGKCRDIKLARQQKLKLENMFTNMNEGGVSELKIVLKSDVQGSSEAISDALEKLSTDKVKVNIVGSSVGSITETDATLAAASNAILLGFNVRADVSARRVIETETLDLRYYSVIYELIDDIKKAMNGMLAPEYKQEIIGLAEVRNVFRSMRFGAIAGCMVTEGIVKRHNKIRILRDNIVIYTGELESLRRFKDDVNDARRGMECGIGIKNYNDIRSGDVIEVFETIEIQRIVN